MDILVNIEVDDLAKAEAFYRDALGLARGRRLGTGVVEMVGGSSPVYLLLKQSGSEPFPAASSRRHYDRHWTPVHLDFVVDDLETSLAGALKAGAVLQEEVAAFEWGRLAQLADPFGHGLCLVEFARRGYDEIAEPGEQEHPR